MSHEERLCKCGHTSKQHLGRNYSCIVEGCPCREWMPGTTDAPLPTAGPSRFEQIATEVGKLVAEKNQAYGDSFAQCGRFLELLYPEGIQPEQYSDVLALVRIFDKQMRIATRKDAFGESPYRDIAGYGLLGAAKDEEDATLTDTNNSLIAARRNEKLEDLVGVLIEHTHDNDPMRVALRKCVGVE